MKFEYEPWELTAYALSELPVDRAIEFEAALATEPALAAELNATREMIISLQTILASDPESQLDTVRRAAVLGGITVGSTELTSVDQSPVTSNPPRTDRGFTLRKSLAVLATLAASILVAATLSGGISFTDIRSRLVSYFDAAQSSNSYVQDLGREDSASATRATDSMASMPEQLRRSKLSQADLDRITATNEYSSTSSRLTQTDSDSPSKKMPSTSLWLETASQRDLYGIQESGSSPRPDAPRNSANELYDYERLGVVTNYVQKPNEPAPDASNRLVAGTSYAPPYLNRLFKTGRESSLRMTVTPHIIIPEEEEAKLLGLDQKGIADQSLLGTQNTKETSEGRGPGMSGDKYVPITDNPFYAVKNQPLSTFSIDVDTASYSKVRQYLMELSQLPRPDAVRIEEFVNYFQYDYAGPKDDKPFASSLAVATCPWQPKHKLVRIALQAKKIDADKRPLSNLVFLIDVSGSMNAPNRLPLVKKSIQMLSRQLGENDQVAIVVYAGAAGLVLDTTSGKDQSTILTAIERLSAGGSTNGGQGIQLAYAKAREQFIPGGVNRVILCTDGDFNVGTTGTDQLVRMMEENAKSKIFCTVLGFGMGNTNDAMLQQIADRGNGMHGFIDTELEANRMMVEQISGSLITVAKDVKIQVEFNPAKVAGYRLIGYENRVLAAQDFNDDKKDAGEIGAGHRVTALYEIIPSEIDAKPEIRDVDASRYQEQKPSLTPAADSGELLTVKLRYKEPEGDKSSLLEFPLVDRNVTINDTDRDFRWAAAIAQFGMLLRQSPYKGDSNWDSLLEIAEEAAGNNPDSYREQALQIMRIAKGLAKR